jgi:hypothetical protein
MEFLNHLWTLFSGISVEKLIGFIMMSMVLIYMLYISRRHRKEIWEGIKGKDHVLEAPEIIILIVMLLYPIVVLADVFLGLHASEGVFWSIDAIIFFALTGKVAMNKFGTASDSSTQNVLVQAIPSAQINEDKVTNKDEKISFILKNSSNYKKADLEKLNDVDLNKIYEILLEAEDNVDEARMA